MAPRILRVSALSALFASLVFAGGSTRAAQVRHEGLRGLFTEAPERAAPARSGKRWIARSRIASVDATAWAVAIRQAPGDTRRVILLNLFDDASFVAVRERLEAAPGGVTWVGRVEGSPLSSVTLSIVGEAMAGSIIMPGSIYAISSAGGRALEIAQIDDALFPQEADPVQPPAMQGDDPEAGQDPPEGGDDGSTIDVMVLYTPAAESSAGGADAIAARINASISETNTSYANSGILQRLRRVHAARVTYTEHNELATDLDILTNHDGSDPISTPLGDAAAALRDVHGADLVVLVTAPPAPQSCGIAWHMDTVSADFEAFAFSVVEEGCLTPIGTFGHELGHNMGARHDWYVDNSPGPHTYAHGHLNLAGRWRTMMAYNNACTAMGYNCTRLLYWSNPAVTYNGAPMGVAGGTKSDCPTGNTANMACDADDHRTLNETAYTVANFRRSVRRAQDYTGDLKSDILWRHATRGEVWLWPMDGTAATAQTYVRTVGEPGWEIRGQGDQTGDGKADVLWRHAPTGMLYLWTMNGTDVAAETYVGTVEPAYDIVGTGDYNGDGRSDLLWRHLANGELWVWLMDGAATLGVHYVDTVDPVYLVKGSGDLERGWEGGHRVAARHAG